MDALILSCGTGGGHDSAAFALKEIFIKNGDNAVMLNPYRLYNERKADKIHNTYISIVRKCPSLFGAGYKIANVVRKIPIKSPVYAVNTKSVRVMEEYLKKHHYDVIICTHLFPSEILSKLKKRGAKIPPFIFVATDYTCIPFTEETSCDLYIIPTKEHTQEFINRGIPKEKIQPLGIPVQSSFLEQITKTEAQSRLGLSTNKRYVLICGGSMGAGDFKGIIEQLLNKTVDNIRLIVVCGSNEKLYHQLKAYEKQIILIKKTSDLALYVKASDLYLSKPGGLSSTEAAVSEIPLVHLPPIPGCETINAEFFSKNGLSLKMQKRKMNTDDILSLLTDTTAQEKMCEQQRLIIPRKAAENIYHYIKELYQ